MSSPNLSPILLLAQHLAAAQSNANVASAANAASAVAASQMRTGAASPAQTLGAPLGGLTAETLAALAQSLVAASRQQQQQQQQHPAHSPGGMVVAQAAAAHAAAAQAAVASAAAGSRQVGSDLFAPLMQPPPPVAPPPNAAHTILSQAPLPLSVPVPNAQALSAASIAAMAQVQAHVQMQAQAHAHAQVRAQADALAKAQADAMVRTKEQQQQLLTPPQQPPPASDEVPLAASSAPSDEDKTPPAEAEVPRCHLHRKANKACKFCKAHASFQDQKLKDAEEKKSTVKEKLFKESRLGAGFDTSAKVPLPNLSQFPQVMKERLLNYRYFNQVLANHELPEVKEALYTCDTCEPEVRGPNTLDMMPSTFIGCVYRLLNLKITEGQLQSLLNNRSRWVRCASFLFIRLGVHQDRYWELLADHLMDDEEFCPFPGQGSHTMTEGQYVEQLLTKEKFCEIPLPRIAVAQRRTINERLVYYDQFRKRYKANLEVIDRYQDPKSSVQVEVCLEDGEWVPGNTVGIPSPGRRRVTVPVRLDGIGERDVSIGMLIAPDKGGSSSSRDLTRSRGRSNRELLEEYRNSQRDAAVATGKDYCKNSGRHTVHAGGVTFVCGDAGEKRRKEDDEDEERELKRRKEERESSREHQAKMAAIMEKYCANPSGRGSSSRSGNGVDQNVDRMRLG